MLECEIKNGWLQFIEFIASRCASAEYENWIAPIVLVEASTDLIILEVPNVFVQEYLLDNFKEVLCNFLPLKVSGEPAIQFNVKAVKVEKMAAMPSEEITEEPPLQ